MEWFESRRKTKLYDDNTRGCFPIYGNISWPRLVKSHNNTKNNNNKFGHRYNVNLHTIIKKLCLLLATSVVSVPAYAEVGV